MERRLQTPRQQRLSWKIVRTCIAKILVTIGSSSLRRPMAAISPRVWREVGVDGVTDVAPAANRSNGRPCVLRKGMDGTIGLSYR